MEGGLTVEQLARSNPMRGFLSEVLRDEQRLGHVERHDGRWRATPEFVAAFGSAFAYVQSPNYVGTRRTEET